MKFPAFLIGSLAFSASLTGSFAEETPPIPRFSLENMDRSVDPSVDFYHFAAGGWLKRTEIPADKSRWASFEELRQRNWLLIHEILDECAAERSSADKSPRAEVGRFYRSFMDTNRIEKLGFRPIAKDLRWIEALKSTGDIPRLLGDFHARGIGGLFDESAPPDAKNSTVYLFRLSQGGLGLPDRDYYLQESFASKRERYRDHIKRMFALVGEKPEQAAANAETVLALETELARASRTRVALRDANANYNKFTRVTFVSTNAATGWARYFENLPRTSFSELNVGQPEFFSSLNEMLQKHSLEEWKTYLRWHVVHSASPYLHAAAENEYFDFYLKELNGQLEQEPRWQRAARAIDASIGEALGQLFVEKHFTAQARQRMAELVGDLRTVFRDRLAKLEWMSEATRVKALQKFDHFTQKIGHPEKFRDYSSIKLRPDDLLGNVQRSTAFEHHRTLARLNDPVDRSEWHMTPPTVNAYFSSLQNEIVFPAGILQPPFFDVEMDDAINYGAIGMVIGHEITHGYDDQGRKYDANGNLNDWWTESDGKEFDGRAQKVVDQYNAYEALPGLHVNGKLTLGENIADLGGASIAYEALERALARDPSKRKLFDGFTPEQRFFISIAQVWRSKIRDAAAQRQITTDPHSPGQFRAIGASVNLPEFYQAFGIKEGAPMWRAPELRAKIW